MRIPQGISTLGYAGCPHWIISQYIFGLSIINPELQQPSKFKLVMGKANINDSGFYITEIHPALSMWILLKDKLGNNKLFEMSWKYKGDSKPDTLKRRSHLIEELLELEIVKKEINTDKIIIKSDDELDAFVCWLMASLLVKKDKRVKIYEDSLNGSFLLPYNEEPYNKLNN